MLLLFSLVNFVSYNYALLEMLAHFVVLNGNYSFRILNSLNIIYFSKFYVRQRLRFFLIFASQA